MEILPPQKQKVYANDFSNKLLEINHRFGAGDLLVAKWSFLLSELSDMKEIEKNLRKCVIWPVYLQLVFYDIHVICIERKRNYIIWKNLRYLMYPCRWFFFNHQNQERHHVDGHYFFFKLWIFEGKTIICNNSKYYFQQIFLGKGLFIHFPIMKTLKII